MSAREGVEETGEPAGRCHLIVEGGLIVDGSGGPAFRGDLAIEGARIAAIGNDPDLRGGIRCGSLLVEEMTVAGS